MSQSHHESDLAYVDDDVLLAMVHDEIEDPEHRERWKHFAREQTLLAIEMARRAFLSIQTLPAEQAGKQEIRKLILNEVAFAFDALSRAQHRAKSDGNEMPSDSIAS